MLYKEAWHETLKSLEAKCIIHTVHVPKEEHSKLEPCAKESKFVGYNKSQKRYKILYPDTNKVTISGSVIINDTSTCHQHVHV